MSTESGRDQARKLFINACEWAEKKGARVILLAAGTKRLFEGRVEELKDHFPNLIFTIGDNGTTLILESETLEVLKRANLSRRAKIAVLGPYGFLGERMLKALLFHGYNVVGIGANLKRLSEIKRKYNIPVFSSFHEATQVDAVVACTHSDKVRITADNVDFLRKIDKKLLVVDVAEPSNLKKSEFKKVADKVIRIDSGNAYSPKLKYVLGVISYKIIRLSQGVTFGCFAETLAIAKALRQGKVMNGIDWFSVTDSNIEIVKNLFEESDGKGFQTPSPRSYGKLVKNFNLDLISKSEQESKFTGQIVCQKIGKALASLIL
jgi:predicted amino acid dehydrogenase